MNCFETKNHQLENSFSYLMTDDSDLKIFELDSETNLF